jgi:hypothetical protein
MAAAETASAQAQLEARLGSALRRTLSHALTVDDTVRRVTLGPGGWRLYGASTQVYALIRAATPAGAIADGEDAAPGTADLAASVAGSPGDGLAWGGGIAGAEASSSTLGGIPLPTDSEQYIEIAVKGGRYVNLYLRVASGTAAPVLVGPFGP